MIETVKVFTSLSEEFVELFMKHHPVAATDAGIHDYDHLLPDDSPAGLQERGAWLRDLEQRLVASVPWDELPQESRVDFALLRSRIASLRAELEEMRTHQKNPALFLHRAFQSVHLLLSRSFAPYDERKEAALARLMAIPEYLDAVRPNLQAVPFDLLEIGLELAAQGPPFVDDVARQLLRHFPGEAERLEHAASRARSGFLRFHEFLDREARPKAGGTFAIGERWMNYKLEREHMLPYNCADLETLGREHIEQTRALLEEEAKRLDPRRTWRELIADGMERTPESHWLREAYVTEVERARAFVLDRHIAPLPEQDRLEVADTPAFERGTKPYAMYQPPAPFDSETTGLFLVTPIDLRRTKEEQARQLAGHCTPMLPLITLHESYPGHHVQLGHANRAASRLRRITRSDVLCEGWAHYCEELMWEQGFFTSDAMTRLFLLRSTLWRACRVVIDVGLHTGRMTPAAAAALLVDEAMVDQASAEAEVRRHCLTPTRPMSNLVGKLLLIELREEAKQRLGPRFDLHDFHGALLASGTIAPSLVREEIWDRLGAG